ncbi:MAG: hypothetical protein JHC61_10350, partial [Burkholderiaceae bacterium]|nr:hypothetical protein [Burkholderiaceae bacterium]
EAKYQQIDDQDLKQQAPVRSRGDDDGRKTPLQQNDRSADKRESD